MKRKAKEADAGKVMKVEELAAKVDLAAFNESLTRVLGLKVAIAELEQARMLT